MKLQKKHFELFKKECQKWINILELNHYCIGYQHTELEKNYAESIIRGDTYIVTFVLTTEIDMNIDRNKTLDELICELAKHEVLHCLLGRFSTNAHSRYINQNELLEAEEELVIKLEKIIK